MGKKKITPYAVISMILLVLVALVFIFPFYRIMTGAFNDPTNVWKAELFPSKLTMQNFVRLFKQPAWKWLYNSVFIALVSMILVCGTASLAGYALAKKRFFGQKIVFTLFICAMALPKQVVLVPLVRIMSTFGIYDNVWAVILPTVGWPFGVFLMKQFSETIPTEMLEAARIDGAGELRTFWSVVFPVVKPGVGALSIFTFINTWNDYCLQLVMLTSTENLTIALGIARLQSADVIEYGPLIAGAALAAIPIVTIFICFQKYFTQGITMGAVKG